MRRLRIPLKRAHVQETNSADPRKISWSGYLNHYSHSEPGTPYFIRGKTFQEMENKTWEGNTETRKGENKQKCTSQTRTTNHPDRNTQDQALAHCTIFSSFQPILTPSPTHPSRAVPGQKVSHCPVPLRHGGGGYLKDSIFCPVRFAQLDDTRDTPQRFVDLRNQRHLQPCRGFAEFCGSSAVGSWCEICFVILKYIRQNFKSGARDMTLI